MAKSHAFRSVSHSETECYLSICLVMTINFLLSGGLEVRLDTAGPPRSSSELCHSASEITTMTTLSM